MREDVLEFSRIQEVGGRRMLLELLRERVGTPPVAAHRQAFHRHLAGTLYRVHRLALALQHRPFVDPVAQGLFFDTGMVGGTQADTTNNALMGLRFQNAVATMLLKHVEFL